jgi:hypothetical protein
LSSEEHTKRIGKPVFSLGMFVAADKLVDDLKALQSSGKQTIRLV